MIFTSGIEVENNKVKAAYLYLREGKCFSSKEIGKLILDFDKEGLLLGIEMINMCTDEDIELAIANQSEKSFLRKHLIHFRSLLE